MPNFLIIGAQKAATTWLSVCLGEHPDVFITQEKEIYFFNVHFENGLGWYKQFFNGWSGQTAVGEATPGYISHPDAPQRIKASLGQVKLIASLRHPVDRAYSAFWHYIRAGQIPAHADFYTWFKNDDRFELKSRGYYFTQLSRFLDYFGMENLLILIYEEIFQDSQHAIARCLKFLGVNPNFTPIALHTRIHSGGKNIGLFHRQAWSLRLAAHKLLVNAVNSPLLPQTSQNTIRKIGRYFFNKMAFEWGPKKKSYAQLDSTLRQTLLQKYYLADIQQLEHLLGRELAIWYSA